VHDLARRAGRHAVDQGALGDRLGHRVPGLEVDHGVDPGDRGDPPDRPGFAGGVVTADPKPAGPAAHPPGQREQ
jgi:hypothetical protein